MNNFYGSTPSSAIVEAANNDSRTALLFAAEQHFALNGISNSSLKTIHIMAGQKNTSAVQYYFKSRNGLIKAILEYRMPDLNQRRREQLDLLIKKRRTKNIRPLVDAWIAPLAGELKPRPGGNYYIRFLQRLRYERADEYREQVSALQPEYRALFNGMRYCMKKLPERIFRSRLAIAAGQTISALGALESQLCEINDNPTFPALAIENLMDYISAGLSTNCSKQTLLALDEPEESTDFRFRFLTDL